MNLEQALKRPFVDFKKLLIGSVLFMIPFINIITGLFGAGYLLKVGKLSMKKNYSMPEWTDWGDLFVRGLLAAVISLLYAIPVVVVALIFLGTSFFSAMLGQPVALVSFSSFGLVLVILLEILLAYVLPSALLAFVERDRFGAAFAFGDVFHDAFTKKYFLAWIVSVVVAIVVGIVAGLLSMLLAITVIGPVIVMGFAAFIIGVIVYTILGQAYGEL